MTCGKYARVDSNLQQISESVRKFFEKKLANAHSESKVANLLFNSDGPIAQR